MDLSIKVGVDAGQALSAVDQLKAKLGQTKENIELLKSELGDLNQSLSRNDKSIAAVNKQLASMKIVTRDDAKEAAALKAQLSSLSQTNSVLVNGISQTKKELLAETESMKALGKEVKAAETAGSGFTAGLNSIWGGLRKIAYIVPGLGIAGLIGLLTGPLVAGFEALIDKLKGVNKELYDTAAFNKNTTESYAKESTSLLLLKTAIEDVNLPMAVRLQAIKDIKKEFPGLFDGLSNEQLLTGNVAGAYDLATAAILRKARASAAATEIEKIEAEKFKLIQKSQEDAAKANEKIRKATAGTSLVLGGSGLGLGGNSIALTRAQIQQTYIDQFNLQKAADQKKLDQFNKTEAFLLKIAEEGADRTIEIDKEKGAKQVKEAETIATVLAKMRRDLNKISAEEDFFGIDKSKDKIREIESAINTLVSKFKLNPKDTLIQGLFGEIKDLLPLMDRVFGDFKIKTSVQIDIDQKAAQKEADDKLGKNPLILKAKISVGGSELDNDFVKALKAIYKNIEDLNTKAAQGLKDTFVNAFVSIGESIGDSLTSGANLGQAVFGNLFKVLGAGLKQLGETMVALGTAKIALEKFKFAPGIGTVVAGIAAIALGAILQKAIPGFADGVSNFGGGVALVGERGPELVNLPRGADVIPNHRLNGLTAGGTQVYIPNVTLRGQDLVVAFNRASQTISRNG